MQIKEDEDLKRELALRDERIIKLLEQLDKTTDQKRELEAVLDDIFRSKSWLITKPLREFSVWRRRFFPLLRWRAQVMTLRAGERVTQTGARFTLHGTNPEISVTGANGEVPSGWLLARGKLIADGAHMFFFLYYRGAEQFDDGKRIWLGFEAQRSSGELIKLPPGVKALKLVPFSTSGSFELTDFTLVEIGTLQAVWHMLRKHLRGGIDFSTLASKVKKAWAIYREGGFGALKIKLFANQHTNNYQEWVQKYDTLSAADVSAINSAVARLPEKPLISIVMPVFNTPERWLRAAIDSVRAQLYPNWELCIADDCSSEPHVKAVLNEYQQSDQRIKVVYRKENGHIAQASNSALSLARGSWVCFLDHDDELTKDALYVLADTFTRQPEAGLVYSDEDKITGYGLRFNPYFKPDWNPELFLCQNYICHLTALQRDILEQIAVSDDFGARAYFRPGLDGAQDWDLFLRASEQLKPEQIVHIPQVLYHWRVIEGSTAAATAYKPYVMEAQARAVRDHLARRGEDGTVQILDSISQLRVRRALPQPQPLVSLVIPTRDKVELLQVCLGSILARTSYKNFEIAIVDNGSREPATLEYFEELTKDARVRVVRDLAPFNFSKINNGAVPHCRGELLGFLNNDLEVINSDWLSELVAQAVRPEVGACGARLLYPNELLQHGGIILGIGGVAGHNHKGRQRHDPGYFNRAILPQNLSAVTAACMLLRRQVFDEVGGFSEELSVAFNDVDLCLKIRARGYQIIYTPYAELYHYESASRGYETTPQKFLRFENEIQLMKDKWGAVLRQDPYYNPNLTLLSEDFCFAFPPRVTKPWRRKEE